MTMANWLKLFPIFYYINPFKVKKQHAKQANHTLTENKQTFQLQDVINNLDELICILVKKHNV